MMSDRIHEEYINTEQQQPKGMITQSDDQKQAELEDKIPKAPVTKKVTQ